MIPLKPKRPDTTEAPVLREVYKHCGRLPYVWLARNNVGVAHFKTGAVVPYGLGKGSADLVGIVVTLTDIGRFFALECKRADARDPVKLLRPEQRLFLRNVNRLGGYGCVVATLTDALEHVERARAGLRGPEIS